MSILEDYETTKVHWFKSIPSFDTTNMVWTNKWLIVGSFDAFVEQASSQERLIAAQRGVSILFIVMWDKSVPLKFDDKLGYRDNKTNQIVYIEITTEPLPNRSESFADIVQASAEIWTPPAEALKLEIPYDNK